MRANFFISESFIVTILPTIFFSVEGDNSDSRISETLWRVLWSRVDKSIINRSLCVLTEKIFGDSSNKVFIMSTAFLDLISSPR